MAEQKKTLSAKQVVADIRAGATDEFLMKKYGVSEKGLQSLFQKLITAKVLTQADLDLRTSAVEEVDAIIVEDDAPVSPKEKSVDVLKDFSERFKFSKEDLERLKTASLRDIKQLMEKHNISLSDSKELLKTLGISTGSLLTQAAGKLKDGTQRLKEELQRRQSTGEKEDQVSAQPAAPTPSTLPKPPGVADSVFSEEQPKSSPMPDEKVPASSEKSEDSVNPHIWYENKKTLILLLIFFTPVGLFGLYKTSRFPQKTKLIIAIIAVILVIAALKPFIKWWVIAGIGFGGGYAIYTLLVKKQVALGKTARIAIGILCGIVLGGTVGQWIDKDKDSGNVPQGVPTQSIPARSTTTGDSAQPKPTPPPAKPVQPTQSTPPSKSQASKHQQPISGIPFTDVYLQFINPDSSLTQAQKTREWAAGYKGKRVRWSGTVAEISEGWLGGIAVIVNMLTGSMTGMDLRFSVKEEQKDKALKLTKNAYITFVGTMESEPGFFMPMSLEDVDLE